MAQYGIEEIREIIKAHGVDSLSAKTVRVRLEEKLGLEAGSLKPNKEDVRGPTSIPRLRLPPARLCRPSLSARSGAHHALRRRAQISSKIDQVLEEMNDDNEEEEEEEDEEPAAKKSKKETKSNDNPNKGKMQCFTRSGEECPKNIKKMQETVKGLSVKKFLESGKTVEINVDGNTLKVGWLRRGTGRHGPHTRTHTHTARALRTSTRRRRRVTVASLPESFALPTTLPAAVCVAPWRGTGGAALVLVWGARLVSGRQD